MLDQIRQHGETKELVDETKTLAKRYGIATPYTSYLIVPDGPVPVTRFPQLRGVELLGRGGISGGVGGIGGGIGGIGGGIGGLSGSGSISSSLSGGSGAGRGDRAGGAGMGMPLGGMHAGGPLPGLGKGNVADFAKDAQQNKGDLSGNRDKLNRAYFSLQPAAGAASPGSDHAPRSR